MTSLGITAFDARLQDVTLREVLDRLPAGVIVTDRRLILRYANLAAQRLGHGLGLRFSVGAPLPPLASDPSLEEASSLAFRRGYFAPAELVVEKRRTLRADGAMHGDLLTIRIEDVTDGARRARAEQDFVVNAAHEFLSPLTSIAGATHVLREGAKDDPEACDRFLRHISEATERLIGISRSLLVLARAEAGVEPPRFEVVGVKSALSEALDTAGLPSQDVSIRCNPSVTVFVDSDLFKIALATVLENARRHSRDGRVELDVDRTEAGRVTVDVVNRSYRLPAERLEMLKTRFRTGAGRDSGGFGIGLSIAERAVRLLDGELTLTSEAEYTKICVHLRSGSFT